MAKLRRGRCATCLPDGGAYFERTYSGPECTPTWTCQNCHDEVVRIVKIPKEGHTRSQKRLIESLPKELMEIHSNGDNYEFKKLEVRDAGDSVSLAVEVGKIGDEGTWGSVICRDYRHIFIGRSGGLRLVNAKHKSKSRGRFNVLYSETS